MKRSGTFFVAERLECGGFQRRYCLARHWGCEPKAVINQSQSKRFATNHRPGWQMPATFPTNP